jgi:DNA-binding Lrp family transcriptional regulator
MANHKGNLKWLQLLAAVNSRHIQKVPPGFKPLNELIKELGVNQSTFRNRVPALLEAKVLERQTFMTERDGVVKQRPYYRLRK